LDFLKDLNEEQKRAVIHKEGPALVLAGAGSGKTRVITYRIGYLIDILGEKPSSILAVTFTNKAADEMKERIYKLISTPIRGIWMGTFHSMCARILREYSEKTPYSRNFVIYDARDQRNLLKRILKRLDIRDKKLNDRYIQRTISNLKNRLIDEYDFEPLSLEQEKIKVVYQEYQKRLKENNAMDFDDLLFNVDRLLGGNRKVKEELNERFKHKLVDEYQDTNHAQYEILKKISKKHKDLFVVGDDDQSIYGFRGADINNILDFEDDFPDTSVYRLERNYRSTQRILRAASSVVKNNYQRKGKTLWTERRNGTKLTLFSTLSENGEARKILYFLKKELKTHKKQNILIAYRTNAQSRAIEDALLAEKIPYTIVGGLRFYQRKEIKDLLAYIKFLVNKRDSISLWRIIDIPRRGIGRLRRSRIEQTAREKGITIWEATQKLGRDDPNLSNFVELIKSLEGISKVDELIRAIIDKTGYIELLKEEDTIESESRIENIFELVSSVKDFTKKEGKYSPEDFLTEVNLRTDIDEWTKSDSVNLMTLHNTKGLEFPVVFITGLSEDILPHYRSLKDGNLEEERRLFYVGITRAKEKVYLSYFKKRGSGWGGERMLIPSRFLQELPPGDVQDLDKQLKRDKFVQEKKERFLNEWVKHPIFGRGRILEVINGDKFLISFDGIKKIIKRRFFE